MTPTEPFTNNGECLYCHQPPGASAVSTVSFGVNTAVNRTTACMKCHWEQTGSHPFHNPTWNCGSCHSGMLFTNPAAIPSVVTTYGYFYTKSSAEADSRTLHIIHSNPTWAGDLEKKGRQCASCHAAAACTACHEDPDLTHADHAWDVGLGNYWPGSGPNGKPHGSGTGVGNEYERNVNTALTCSNPVCHMTASGDDA
ncbi:MAG: hypothetical protein C0418_06265, partial [Coriobacteriaceae bacterium]|nr:hypothetical protein [Coriobacteriaceae bacterium]